MQIPDGHIKCKICGVIVPQVRFNQKTCGRPECVHAWKKYRYQHQLARRKCVICGTEFQPRNSKHLTCCPECSAKRSAQKSAESNKRRKRRFSPRRCSICGKEYTPSCQQQATCGSPECKAKQAARTNAANVGHAPLLSDDGWWSSISHYPGCMGPADPIYCPMEQHVGPIQW